VKRTLCGEKNLQSINWTVYGKIKSITKPASAIYYGYDAAGNRVHKKLTGTNATEEIYVRDAQGNSLAVYRLQGDSTFWKEQHLYGSSRLGIYQYQGIIPAAPVVTNGTVTTLSDSLLMGNTNYELSNHLGNVLAVVNDKKIGVSSVTDSSLIDHYVADVLSLQDYYAFGSQMVGRSYQANKYRYGFNGKENDHEVKGEGNQQDYGMRIYDQRIGKFLSVDPLVLSYPWYTPYQFSGNNPILFIDRDGAEPERNPKSAGMPEMVGKTIVFKIKQKVEDAYHDNEAPLWFWPVKAPDVRGIFTQGTAVGYISDTRGDMAYKLNMYVSTKSQYLVNESNAGEYNNYEGAVTYDIMRSFVSGKGPENYVFPKNGIISSKFLKSDVVKTALSKFLNSPNSEYGPRQSEFGMKELGKDIFRSGSMFSSITGLVGSAQINIKPGESGIDISIFNITSLTSGTFGKEALKVLGKIGIDYTNLYPSSYVRNPDDRTPYGNISQTFSLFIPYNKTGDKYKNIKDVISKGKYSKE
jgi:RHS repeat-associated protein